MVRLQFATHARQGLARDGSHPAMMYGYGGFSISVLPAYRSDVPAWLELGGIFVSVNTRGGAEHGESWHQAGSLERQQNVFDDFIAVGVMDMLRYDRHGRAIMGDRIRLRRRSRRPGGAKPFVHVHGRTAGRARRRSVGLRR